MFLILNGVIVFFKNVLHYCLIIAIPMIVIDVL